MLAWTIGCSCIILYVSLQIGQAERIRGNDLQDDYDDDLEGLGTDVWTEKNSAGSETDTPTGDNRTTDIYGANHSTTPRSDAWTVHNSTTSTTDVWTVSNLTGSTTDVWTDDNSSGSGMVLPTDNNATRPETRVSTDNIVTQPVTDVTTAAPRKEISKTIASTSERPTGISTLFPEVSPQDIFGNSSCPDALTSTTAVPEGENVTLRCGIASGAATLWWYRNYTFLQRGSGEVVLHIPDADGSQSGLYLCVDERGCCVLEHNVSVYRVPQYAYHLAVMGAVLAVGIPLCVFLSVRQSSRLGRYARMFNERHGEAKLLIL